MLGSGIYGLIGQAAGQVGNAVWLAFAVALIAALLTALTYASLASRYPKAGGAAYITQRAYKLPILSFIVGLGVVCSGLSSVATQSRVFAANLATLTGAGSVPIWVLALGFLLILAGIVFRGIRESMWVNVVCTAVEATGLLIVIGYGISHWGSVDYFATPGRPEDPATAILIMQGAVLTFFAYIGFEDAINVAEECRDPERTIPIGLVAAMLLAALLYMAVAITAISVVPWQELAAAPGPLTEVMKRAAPNFPPIIFTGITLFAVANTALVNYVTSTRLIYGMAKQGLLPASWGAIHPQTRTPHVATGLLLLILVPLATIGTIKDLAAATVIILLTVFAIMNGALYILQRRTEEPPGKFEIGSAVPLFGAVICTVLVVFRIASGDFIAPAIAGGLLAGILAIYWVMRPVVPDSD